AAVHPILDVVVGVLPISVAGGRRTGIILVDIRVLGLVRARGVAGRLLVRTRLLWRLTITASDGEDRSRQSGRALV
ncbi:MAG: hypothetical protein WD638_03720, partial [Nitriliruptoraceae bacterium]